MPQSRKGQNPFLEPRTQSWHCVERNDQEDEDRNPNLILTHTGASRFEDQHGVHRGSGVGELSAKLAPILTP